MINLDEMSNEIDDMDFGALLDEYMPEKEEGELKRKVLGTIVEKGREFAYLEVDGEPSRIRVRTNELEGYEVGDKVEVLILSKIEEDESEVFIASKKRIEMEKGLEILEKALEEKTPIKGKIIKKVKGGFVVEIEHQQSFLPNSLSELSQEESDDSIGKEIDVQIKEIKDDRKGKKILVSRKELVLEKERERIAELSVGDTLNVKILEILDFGLIVDLNGARGFIHISEVDWKKTADLHQIYKVGDTVEAKIVEVDVDKRNVKLSIKALKTNPWEVLADKYKVGEEVEGEVKRIVKYGAFVEVIPGVEGLIHSSDFSWTNKNVHINSFVKIGDKVKVVITELNPQARKLKLGIKQLSQNPWENAEEKYKVGTVLSGKVVEVKAFGIFVQVEEGVDAFIHNSDASWIPNKKFVKGDEVTFEVIELNIEDQKIKGSIKVLEKSPWENAEEKYKVGDVVVKPIKNIQDFGLFIKLENGVDGFIPVQLASKDFIKNIQEEFKVGEEIKAEIIEIDSEKKRIKLSVKKLELENDKNEEQELIEKYGTSSSDIEE